MDTKLTFGHINRVLILKSLIKWGGGISVKIIPESNINIDLAYKEARNYSLVIANTIVVYRVVEVFSNLLPVVWYIREAQNLPQFFWKKGREEAIRSAKELYVVSEYAKEFIVENYNKNVKVLHNCVDDVYVNYNNLKRTADKKLKFLAMGTIEKRKGYDILIKAFMDLPKDIAIQCELHFAGRLWEGAKDFYPVILSEIKNQNNIFYHGELRERDKIHELIAKSDVIVVPSRDESCSLVALEGAMMAKPLILTENIGAKYVVSKNSGWIVKTANVISLKNALIEAYTQWDNLCQIGHESRENYLRTSTYEIYEKNILKMVEDTICENQYLYQISHRKFELFSFDVYDTIISRKVAEPKFIFTLIKDRINDLDFPPYFVEDFENIRINTEQYLYQNTLGDIREDTNFDEIYETIQKNYCLNKKQIKILKSIEIEIEKENSFLINENFTLIQKLIKENKRVILISDMYFSKEILREILSSFSEIFKEIPLYVSSEYGFKKNNGKLFKKIMGVEKISPENWIHCGDNWRGDYLEPKKLGIEANIYQKDLLPHEYYLLREIPRDPYLQYIIGISRQMRIEDTLTELGKLGVSFGGPMLLIYVEWVLYTAIKQKIKKLFFISRDGYILQKIAEMIIQKKKLDVDTGYLYISRYAVNLAREKQGDQYNLLKQYLRQECACSKKFSLVELTGTGETLEYISNIISDIQECADNFCGILYLYRSCMKYDNNSIFAYPIRERPTFAIELFVRSLEGQVIGYTMQSGKIVPLLEENEGKAIKKIGYESYIDGVMKYVSRALYFFEKGKINGRLSFIDTYIKYLNGKEVNREIVEVLGNIPFALNDVYTQGDVFLPRKIQESSYYPQWQIFRCYDEKYKKQQENKIIKMEVNNYYGAVDVVRSHLSYKVGKYIVSNVKSPWFWLGGIVAIPCLILSHKIEKNYTTGNRLKLSEYKDYQEALQVKQYLSYKIGNALIKNPLLFVFNAFSIYREYRRKNSHKPK